MNVITVTRQAVGSGVAIRCDRCSTTWYVIHDGFVLDGYRYDEAHLGRKLIEAVEHRCVPTQACDLSPTCLHPVPADDPRHPRP